MFPSLARALAYSMFDLHVPQPYCRPNPSDVLPLPPLTDFSQPASTGVILDLIFLFLYFFKEGCAATYFFRISQAHADFVLLATESFKRLDAAYKYLADPDRCGLRLVDANYCRRSLLPRPPPLCYTCFCGHVVRFAITLFSPCTLSLCRCCCSKPEASGSTT
jgi:hypothetical protein